MKTFFRAIGSALRFLGKIFTIIRNTFFNLLFFGFLVFLIFFVFSQKKTENITRQDSGVLRLDISGNVVEEKIRENPLEKIIADPVLDEFPQQTSLYDLLDAVNTAAKDKEIKAILLNLKYMRHAGLNQLITLGEALNNFKKSGKLIVAAEDFYTQSQYLLASYADIIAMNPMGGVDIHGLGVYRLYFKDAIDKLEINYNIFKVGSYKSALEPLTRTNMSQEDKMQSEQWLTALWKIYSDNVAANRHLPADVLKNYTNNTSESLSAAHGDAARLALNVGLVDKLLNRVELSNYLNETFGKGESGLQPISTADYLSQTNSGFSPAQKNRGSVGIIVAEGNIVPGKQPPGMIGGDSTAFLIKRAAENDTIKALVLRINSGGGSAFASEVIRNQLREFKKSGKPFIVSMGSVAASGGYWIAADADQIWAENSTITGSIGIFGAIPTFEKSLEKLGIYSDGVGTTPIASGLNIAQSLPEELHSVIQQSVENSYGKFLQLVANGRNMDVRKVSELAQGRVYDGLKAQSLGLVDEIGDLNDAITAAATAAGLTNYDKEFIRPPQTVRDQLFMILQSSNIYTPEQDTLARKLTQTIRKNFDIYFKLQDPNNIFAFFPADIRM